MGLFSIFRKKEKKEYRMTEQDLRWNRFIEEVCSKESSELTAIQRRAALCFWYDAEMHNGGHCLYFDCCEDTDPRELIDALLAVAYPEIAENFKKALSEGEYDDWRETDRAFDSFVPSLCDCIQKYVEQNHNTIFEEPREHQIEELYAEALLWTCGFHSGERYNKFLDQCFLSEPDNPFYLELEELSRDVRDTIGRIDRYQKYEQQNLDCAAFGRQLFTGLKDAYLSNTFSIQEFGRLSCRLWNLLPKDLLYIEPFWTLEYADDCLSWDDEAQARALYEKAFAFYEQTEQ